MRRGSLFQLTHLAQPLSCPTPIHLHGDDEVGSVLGDEDGTKGRPLAGSSVVCCFVLLPSSWAGRNCRFQSQRDEPAPSATAAISPSSPSAPASASSHARSFPPKTSSPTWLQGPFFGCFPAGSALKSEPSSSGFIIAPSLGPSPSPSWPSSLPAGRTGRREPASRQPLAAFLQIVSGKSVRAVGTWDG